MTEQLLQGAPASPGLAVGTVWRRAAEIAGDRVAWEDHDRELSDAHEAIAGAAEALEALAKTLPSDDAEIVRAGVLMAQDPALIKSVEHGVLARGLPAAEAILEATADLADAIAAVHDPTLAARADDVRSFGRRAARLTSQGAGDAPPTPGAVLIERDLGPADVAELAPALAGIALVGGGATAHAAIVARSLGVPMVASLPEQALQLADGEPVVLDGARGTVVVDPGPERAAAAQSEMNDRRTREALAAAHRDEPAVTLDGRRIAVLANVAGEVELDVALRAGAEGIGLLRTELSFLSAREWPSEEQHLAALEPVVAGLGSRPAVIRVLDIGPDKCPPFAQGVAARGVALLLEHEDAFAAQLRALVRCARDADIRILLPMVDRPEQVLRARALLRRAAEDLGSRTAPIALGAMIETETGARGAHELARCSDFFSIGTNDLTASVLGVDRFGSGSPRTQDPAVLRLIGQTVTAARAAGIAVEVCGEAASDEHVLPLLLGLGVEQVSVGAARVGVVRRWIRELSLADAIRSARSAECDDGARSAECDDDGAQRLERGRGIHALGA